MPITDMLPGGQKGWRRWGFAAASVVVHGGLLAALVLATEKGEAAEEPSQEEVTYVDISRFAPPPPPSASEPQPSTPEPQQTQPQPTQPRPEPTPRPEPESPPRAADILEPEDSIPDEPLGADAPPEPAPPQITAPSPATSVSPLSGGRSGGQSGGQTGGVEGGVEGGKAGGVVGGQGEEVPDPGGTYVAAVVDRQAELRNRDDLARILERLYPPAMRDARQGGRVVVQFVVGTNGRVDMSTVKITSSTHDDFEDATRKALREFRFRPARMGDREVRMLTQLPVVWEVR